MLGSWRVWSGQANVAHGRVTGQAEVSRLIQFHLHRSSERRGVQVRENFRQEEEYYEEQLAPLAVARRCPSDVPAMLPTIS